MNAVSWYITAYLTVLAALTAMAATMPGLFLILRGSALMSDAISHALLPGIVVMFLMVKRLHSTWLFFGASLAGLLVVTITQLIVHSQRIKKEIAIGLVFPLFFSIGVIMISCFARTIHLDADMVLLGDMVFTPFMPYPLALIALVLIGNIVCITLFYKQLVMALVDQDAGYLMGLRPYLMHHFLMIMTTMTAVAAFDIVGSMVVVALMIVPAATALLLSYRLEKVITISLWVGAFCGVAGYWVAHFADISIAGAIAMTAGIIFFIVLFLTPRTGLGARFYLYRGQQQWLMCLTLQHWLDQQQLSKQWDCATIAQELGWSERQVLATLSRLELSL